MPPMTMDTLRATVREVAGEVYAERMTESAARGREASAPPAETGALDWQGFLRALQDSGGHYRAGSPGWAAIKAGDRFFRTVGALQAGDGSKTAALAWLRAGAVDQLADGVGTAARSLFKSNAPIIERDLSSVIQSGGAVLIREEVSDDLIEFLRPAQVLAGLGARDVPMQSTELVIPAHTIGSTGGWIGEGEPIPVTEPGFGAVEMRLRTYASVVPVPIDLIRYAFNNAEAFVAGDMRLDIASALDLAHLRGSGTNGQPLGVRWRGRVTRSLGDTTDNIINDLVGTMTRAGEASMPMQRMGWGLNWRVWQRLFTIRDGIGGFLFKDEMTGGTLLGAPFRRSAVIRSNYDPYSTGTANKTELFWLDLDTVLIGRGDGVAMYTSQDGAYETSGGVKSALSRNQIVIRAVIKSDVNVRYRDGVQVVDGINWIN